MPSHCTPEYQREYRQRRKVQGRPLPSGSDTWNAAKREAWRAGYYQRPAVKVGQRRRAAWYRQHEPAKYQARKAVRNALRRGELTRKPCACGNRQSEAHHDDYGKPLNVVWVCRGCHSIHHRKAKGDV